MDTKKPIKRETRAFVMRTTFADQRTSGSRFTNYHLILAEDGAQAHAIAAQEYDGRQRHARNLRHEICEPEQLAAAGASPIAAIDLDLLAPE